MSIITKDLLREILGCEISNFHILSDKVHYTIPNHQSEEDGELVYIDLGLNINKHELAIKIVDKIISLGYVASLTKIKSHWWCEFATENYYKNNGIMSHGSIDGERDIDTKSDNVLICAVLALEWILENKGD